MKRSCWFAVSLALLLSPGLVRAGLIHDAAKARKFDTVRALVLLNPFQVMARDERGRTPLHAAAWAGDEATVNFLLGHGAKPDARDNEGYGPLHFAAYHGHLAVCRILLDRGASPNLSLPDGWAPLHAAVKQGHLEVAALLIERGADVNAMLRNGWRPLHLAIEFGQTSIVDLLLSKGASPNQSENLGSTPLHFAVRRKNLEAMRLLLDRGADVNAKSLADDLEVICLYDLPPGQWGCCPASISTFVPQYFVFSGIGVSPLHVAVDESFIEGASLLLEHGANINAKDRYGKTPLQHALQKNSDQMVRFLLERGATE